MLHDIYGKTGNSSRQWLLRRRSLLWRNSISPPRLGQKCTDAVVACLTGLEEEEKQGILEDHDGIVVGLAHITMVLKRLEEISV